MEAIITIVGFLGAGKTTLLKHLTDSYISKGWNPYIILNDYENADLDAVQFTESVNPQWLKALTGSCICCSGINELRDFVNGIPERENGITLIEANGTSDACTLMEFLGVGINERFLPPIQISVVDVKNWQKREENNELELNQVQVSSLLVLTHTTDISEERKNHVIADLKKHNPYVKIVTMDALDITVLPELSPSKNIAEKLEHHKAHWASSSVDLPKLPNLDCVYDICNSLPNSILRVKGCAVIGNDNKHTYFEKTPDGKISTRPFNGIPTTGSKLLTIGPGSDIELLKKSIQESITKANLSIN